MNKISELSGYTKIRNTLYSEAAIGISGNSFLLLFHIFMFIHGQRPRLTDPLIRLLSLIHILMLLVMSLVATDIFMLWKRWDDTTCKFVFFLYRLLRSLSLCATSMLSILQAITLSPRSSCLAKFKHKSPYHMLGYLLFLSIFFSSISSPLLTYITAAPNLTLPTFTYITQSCCLLPMSYSVRYTFFILLTSRDAIFVVFMVLASVYMVTFLRRHKKQSQLLHSASLSLKPFAEQRATQSILWLMSFFVVMYTVDSVISYLRSTDDGLTLHCVHILTAHGYATVSPFLVLSTEKHIIYIFRSLFGRMVNVILLWDG
ncbi:vomeronasal type-1 receptor 54-like [Acomys russatus]|uniref:vomeronasal type-1 receptor 54-like n=1 Tax=Acomys russatus TaxID=60746 RepID=UPI0021E33E6C|nr:vomeronasal type-1 receptor 54-like [Acomys russatus]